MKPAILTCALVGGTPSRNPHHPRKLGEIVSSGIAAARAGASVLHIHARGHDGEATQDAGVYREIAEGIRAEVDVILNFTTGGSPGMSEDQRLGSLGAKPELASLDAGTLNFGADDDFYFVNTPRFQQRAATEMLEAGIKPELECFDSGMIVAALELLERQLVRRPPLFQLVLGVRGGAPAGLAPLVHLVSLLPADAEWGAFAIGRDHFSIMAGTLALGGHIRTGMEDCVYMAARVPVEGNAQLVARAVEMCRVIGREVATVDQARAILASSDVVR